LGLGKKPEATPAPAPTTPVAPEGSVAPIAQPEATEPQLNIPTVAEPTATPVSPAPSTENALPTPPAPTETQPTA
jgi:hypothetical protein